MRVHINGINLAYTDEGKGLPVVFLHAFPFNRTMWEPQVQTFSTRYRIIAVDLRGHGESDAGHPPGGSRYTLDLLADDVKGLLDHLGVQRAVLAGLSMGGYLSFAFYRKYPERVKALVLADTRAEADKPEVVTRRVALAQKVSEEGAQAAVEEMGPKLLSPKAYRTNPMLVEWVRTIILSTPVSAIVGDLMAMAERPDSTPLLAQIACPTLVLAGREDVLTTPEENKRIADGITHARWEVIPEAGHLSNLEQPELFNRAVAAFLEGIR